MRTAIATNACLNALRHSSPAVLPGGLGGPSTDPAATGPRDTEIPWLEPIPDSQAGPAAIVAGRTGLRLALIAALQHLPPQQRTVLILRDVLSWPAEEAADVLGVTPAAVHSTLQRARARLDRLEPAADEITEPAERIRWRKPARTRALPDWPARCAISSSSLCELPSVINVSLAMWLSRVMGGSGSWPRSCGPRSW
ncbi:sigma factor-like helix-turn-helix DNA-binding protein [Actinomadura chokoriensis]|uniref:sigma factor-like helix-turn-helix DNA-binding protein n=1 Tax=Actinomadura chokoriensis TaxID=454156 RepID=UPI0031F7D13D